MTTETTLDNKINAKQCIRPNDWQKKTKSVSAEMTAFNVIQNKFKVKKTHLTQYENESQWKACLRISQHLINIVP